MNLLMERAAASARGGEGDEPGYHCALTGDRLFGAIHPHELVEELDHVLGAELPPQPNLDSHPTLL